MAKKTKRGTLVYEGVYEDERDGETIYRIRWQAKKHGKLRWRQETLPVGTTLGQAIDLREERQHETRAGREKPARETVGEYAKRWSKAQGSRLAPSTRRSLGTCLEHHVLPYLGNLYCDAVTRDDVHSWAVELERARYNGRPYAQSTLGQIWHYGRRLLQDMAADLGRPDPTRRVRAPESPRRRPVIGRALTREELDAMLAEAGREIPRNQAGKAAERYALVAVMAYGGLRCGEARALMWDQVDLGAGEITVCATMSLAHRRGNTKTGSDRTVPMCKPLQDGLQVWRRQMMEIQHPGLVSGLVFPSRYKSEATGWHKAGAPTRRLIRRIAERAGIGKVKPHDLRRTCNTLLVQAGVNKEAIKDVLGHMSDRETQRYYRSSAEDKRAAVEAAFDGPVGS